MGATGLVTEGERWERERLVESLEAYQRGVVDAPVVHKHALDGTLPAFADGPVSDGPITSVASDETEDRLGDVLRTGGWDLEAYRRNPVFLWAHDYTHTPVGRQRMGWSRGPALAEHGGLCAHGVRSRG